MRRIARAALSALTVLAVLAGCTGCGLAAVDKQGVKREGDIVTLHLGAADPGEPSLAYFVDAVDRESGGRLRVDVDRDTYFSETPGGPARLAGDLRSGRVDLALIPSRDWAATGDPGFAALQTPFLVTSTAVTVALAQSDVADSLLTGMAAYDGVVGLGLVPGEPRRLLTREPVVDESDLRGSKVRVSDSNQTMSLLTALGADPVQGLLAADVRVGLSGGELDGVEMAPIYLGQNGFNEAAPYLSSVALIPKFEVLAASSPRWGDLTRAEQDALSKAATETVDWESARLPGDEEHELSTLCQNGLVVVAPSASTVAAWRRAAPVPEGAPADQVVENITTDVLHEVPAIEAPDLSSSCTVATSAPQARRLHRAADPGPAATAPASGGPTIPPGTYVETVTAEQFAEAGLVGADWAADVTYTWVFRPDGTFTETQQPDYPDQGPQVGRYVVDGSHLTMTYVAPQGFSPLSPERATWSYFDGTLTFSEIEVEDPGTLPLYQQPWHKVD